MASWSLLIRWRPVRFVFASRGDVTVTPRDPLRGATDQLYAASSQPVGSIAGRRSGPCCIMLQWVGSAEESVTVTKKSYLHR